MVLLTISTLAACGDGTSMSLDPMVDARAAAPDAAPIADLDMQLADFASIPGLMTPAGRNYQVANLLGRETEALAAASSPTGGAFPVGSVVLVQKSEIMVKRRSGFNATTNDWEFFRVEFAPDGTPTSFSVRGAEQTGCFDCHQMVSSITWDFICDHP